MINAKDLITLLDENKDFIKPLHLTEIYKIEESKALEILEQAEVFGIASNILNHVDWRERTFIKSPDKISLESINKFQEFLDKNFNDINKRNYQKWECVSCGIIIKAEKKPNKCSCGRRNLKNIEAGENKVSFDFEYIHQDIKSLDDLKKIIMKNFPSIWFETKACLSTCATLSLKNLNGCPSLNLIGSPSGEKTTTLSFFYGQDKTYLSDDFTPRSFVSHSANVKVEELGAVDLLPRLKNKVLITPELAPLFESPRDKLIDNFSMLTRVLDGEGLNRDSGVHGHRGYSGDYKFAWLGASTPIRASVWNVMGKIGNRLFFLNMREKKRDGKDYLEMFSGRAYEQKVKECRGAVRSFLDHLYKQNLIRSLEWDAEGDIFILKDIIKYAQFLSKLRGSLMLWKSEEKGKYEFSFPVIEEPPRAINSLYNLAKGHALIHDRNFLKKEDLEIVKAIAFSSMPHDRYEFLKLLAKHEGKLTTSQIENELNCSQDTALRTMKIFEILGVVKIKSINIDTSSVGRPMKYIEINQEFQELLEHTQGTNDEINNKSQEIKSVCDAYDDENLIEIVKFGGKMARTHPEFNEINNKSQEINSVSEIKTPSFKTAHQLLLEEESK